MSADQSGREATACLYGRDPADCSACQEAQAIHAAGKATAEDEEHFPWHYTEFGVVCACGRPMRDEVCPDQTGCEATPTTALYGPTGEVLAEVVVPPFPMDPAATVCPCGGIGTTHGRDRQVRGRLRELPRVPYVPAAE